jgi:hypothetical protein
MSSDKEEKLIRELMLKSEAKMPFSDFEDKLMEKIYLDEKTTRSFMKDVKLSWFFFAVGTLFGLFLSTIAGVKNGTILGFPSQPLILVVQAVFVIFSLSLFDKLIGLTGKNREAHHNQPAEAEKNWHE